MTATSTLYQVSSDVTKANLEDELNQLEDSNRQAILIQIQSDDTFTIVSVPKAVGDNASQGTRALIQGKTAVSSGGRRSVTGGSESLTS